MRIGVLALQGAVTEHCRMIERIGATAVVVKCAQQLAQIDGLILPGGESTAMRRLIDDNKLLAPLQQFATRQPVFGTCAGLILLAEHIIEETSHIAVMRVTAQRNAFGRQVASFETTLTFEHSQIPAIFIRAPKIVSCHDTVEILATYNGDIVCAREGHLLACSFHPELSADLTLMRYFAQMIQQHVAV